MVRVYQRKNLDEVLQVCKLEQTNTGKVGNA